MKTFFLLLSSFLLAKADPIHLRYTIDLPPGTSAPIVVDTSYLGSGRIVALSSGGNLRKSDGQISWLISTAPPESLWFELVAPDSPAPGEVGDFNVRFANGSITVLSPSSSLVPTSLLSLLGNSSEDFDADRDFDGDSLPLAMEYLLSLSDERKNKLMDAFTVVQTGDTSSLRGTYQPLSDYLLLLVPALGTAPGLEPIVVAPNEGTNEIEIPDLPKTFIFQARLIPVTPE